MGVRPTKEPGEAKESIDTVKEIVELDHTMIENKMTKTHSVPIIVKHNKHEFSKDKRVDYQERNHVSLTKPVGKTHISNLLCLGKKNKKTQKKKKKKKKPQKKKKKKK